MAQLGKRPVEAFHREFAVADPMHAVVIAEEAFTITQNFVSDFMLNEGVAASLDRAFPWLIH
jgi:hypothetical protein